MTAPVGALASARERSRNPGVPAPWSGDRLVEGPRPPNRTGLTRPFALALVLLFLPIWGCRTPVGADRTTARVAYREITATALEGQCSDDARRVLRRYNLEKPFAKDPRAALVWLHDQACVDGRRDLLYALSELNYLRGERLARSVKPGEPRRARDAYLAAAIYAWLYLLGDGAEAPPDPFDRRFRVACDLYNRAVALGFARGQRPNTVIELAGGTRVLSPGAVEVRFHPPSFKWDLEEIEKFLPADEYLVRGLTVRDRQSGLGAPLIGVGKTLDQKRFSRRIPATVLLRTQGDVRDWSAGRLTLSLELYSTYETDSAEVNGRTVPLEVDTTAPLAYSLNDAAVWKLGTAQFLSAEEKIKTGIYFTQPYEPGRVPVIFVHGTLSSPVWWAEMWNTLRLDQTLRERCQFWNFIYNSGNPVTYSAANLRDAIHETIEQLDPHGRDPALRQMVVVGHSQGGLLTKLTVVDTGDRLWTAACRETFESLRLPPEDLELLRRNFFFTALPSVKRVVFISTPHRGSYLATGVVRAIARRFMRLPGEVVRTSQYLVQGGPGDGMSGKVRRCVPTCLDSMSPKNPVLLALADMPLAPGVTGHSIIAVKGEKAPATGGDGVVKYASAHVEGVASELVVRRSHSCQDKPETIEEVRRILLEHLTCLASPGR